ncbi:MAG: hypothetical protein JRI46_03520 [Deltaproteobacteria bacterium]|nr:hypothetical protein [Deltaproteobacteria bacterium]
MKKRLIMSQPSTPFSAILQGASPPETLQKERVGFKDSSGFSFAKILGPLNPVFSLRGYGETLMRVYKKRPISSALLLFESGDGR